MRDTEFQIVSKRAHRIRSSCSGRRIPVLAVLKEQYPLINPRLTREKLINHCARKAQARKYRIQQK